MRQTTQLSQLFGAETVAQLAATRILVVGAGGIGCELLKNLGASGFHRIVALDLDTIDLSNLNRQFLFQRTHLSQPKSTTAAQAITRFNPGISAEGILGNVKDARFTVDWFSRFGLVFNALDNLEARRHVNAMCLAAHVPLVESGTAGHLGQVTVIDGGSTECFECRPKAAERRTYPVCTIRSTPTAPVHCVVWAKDYLFAQLFGAAAPLPSDAGDVVAADVAEELREEERALAELAEARGRPDFARRVFAKVFGRDVRRLLANEHMWAQRRAPEPLEYDELARRWAGRQQGALDPAAVAEHEPMAVELAFALFCHATEVLAQRHVMSADGGAQTFDKDDLPALWFVAATASLRSYVFGITQRSIFDIKAIAGNIIPAVATTNAIAAGLMVVQGITLLAQKRGGRPVDSACCTAYLAYNARRPRSILREPLAPPNPRCPVCRRRYLTLRVGDFSKVTLGGLLRFVGGQVELGGELSVVEGSRILSDPDYEDNLEAPLESLGISEGAMLTVAGEDDTCCVPVVLSLAGLREGQEGMVLEGVELVPEFGPLPEQTEEGEESVEEEDGLELVADELEKRRLTRDAQPVSPDDSTNKKRAVDVVTID
ncbi:E1 ubiquitin-activating protein uba2 [Coemansia interrupta]|uniref:Ubiquitin-activating enzyme E1-like n=1 Tax=Coemansia interrupta TaxID=1126814 RepID=A0A9W8LNL5_9FUNG|nr:E1 ubiquitin-activating protein uba2 [Coemansia interrupta]